MEEADVTEAFEGVDFFVDESLYDDPYPYLEYLRETKGPVWIDDRYNMAVVTGHDEEVAVLRDNETFSSCNAPAGPFAPLPVEVEGDDAGPVIDQYRDQMPMHEYMVTMDRPQHDDYRGLMKRLFTPRRLAENEDFMWRLADEQMKRLHRRGRGRVLQRVLLALRRLGHRRPAGRARRGHAAFPRVLRRAARGRGRQHDGHGREPAGVLPRLVRRLHRASVAGNREPTS